jgi:hypothetical protein
VEVVVRNECGADVAARILPDRNAFEIVVTSYGAKEEDFAALFPFEWRRKPSKTAAETEAGEAAFENVEAAICIEICANGKEAVGT